MNLLYINKIIQIIFLSLISLNSLANNPIKICLAGRIVENLDSYGKSFRNAAQLAIDNSGFTKKIKIEYYFYDNSPLKPMYVHQKMINENCSAIIGFEYLSDLLLAIKEQKDTKVPIFTSYASKTIADKLPSNIFMLMPSYDYQALKMIDFLQKKFNKLEKVLLITEINREEMLKYKEVYSTELNNKNIKFNTFDFMENDPQILAKLSVFLKKNNYHYVFLLSGAIASAKIADAMNKNNTVFVGTENFGSSVSPSFYTRLKNKVIQSYFIRNIDYLRPTRGLSLFRSIYKDKVNEEPTVLAAYTYDAMNFLITAYKKTGFIDTSSIYKINYIGLSGAYFKKHKFHYSDEFVILSVHEDGYHYEN